MLYKLLASLFGIGYLKGGGTFAALATSGIIYSAWRCCPFFNNYYFALIGFAIFLAGIFIGNKVEPFWGKDNYRVVIDEVAGMWVTMLFVPVNFQLLIAGFILFRFFDIVKPFYIKRMEKMPGGVGVMMDDVLAGVYANIMLHIIIYTNLLPIK